MNLNLHLANQLILILFSSETLEHIKNALTKSFYGTGTQLIKVTIFFGKAVLHHIDKDLGSSFLFDADLEFGSNF
jgi:hypothetical protein